jgi:hypothetical protein
MRKASWVVLGVAGLVWVGCGGSTSGGKKDPGGIQGEAGTASTADGGRSDSDAGTGSGEGSREGSSSSTPEDAPTDGKAKETGGVATTGDGGTVLTSDGTVDRGTGTTTGTVTGATGTVTGTTGTATGTVSEPPSGVGVVGIRGGTTVGPVPGGIYDEGPAPVDCEPIRESTDADYCQTDLTCTNDSMFVFCGAAEDGSWGCQCSSNHRVLFYELTGVDSGSACVTAVEVCSAEELPEFTEPETCATQYQTQGSDHCDVQEQCTQSAEVSEGVTALRSNWKYANCYVEGGQWLCYCGDDTTSQNYQISGTTAAAACQLARDLCDRDEEVVFDGPQTCETAYQSVGSGYCELQRTCSQSTEVTDAATALRLEGQFANCQDLEDGTSACNCSDSEGNLRFDVATPATTLDTCTDALAVCAAADDIELSGAWECDRSYQSAGAGWCDGQISCSQAATQGDLELQVYGDLFLSCQTQASDAPWNCTCSSGQESASLEVESEDAWDVCSVAAERCPDLVEVQLGGGGDFIGGPVGVPVRVPL